MKPYFTRYIPVEGKPGIGDHFRYEEGEFEQKTKVELFLCSRDIQVGDPITSTGDSFFTATEHHVEKHKGDYFKKIGRISPDALSYVKEGEEFTKDQVRFNIMNGDFHVDTVDTIEEALSHGYYEAHSEDCQIIVEIKGPCSHFH